MTEFDLIKRCFTEQVVTRKDVVLPIGDDCALVQAPEKMHIAVTTDTLVAGVHFPHQTPPRAIGHKSLAVSLSDLAAMGAEPSWISLALTMPQGDEAWLNEFCAGLFELCEYYNVQLIGGDTTSGPLSITVTAQGLVPAERHIPRSGAKIGDWIYVTGDIGLPALALMHLNGQVVLDNLVKEQVLGRLNYPKPKVLAGQLLKDYATAAVDISDGLLADLGHICQASNLGANIVQEALPISPILFDYLGDQQARQVALTGGDDYELLFTVSDDNKVAMETALSQLSIPVTCIGQTNATANVSTTYYGQVVEIGYDGFQHFRQAN